MHALMFSYVTKCLEFKTTLYFRLGENLTVPSAFLKQNKTFPKFTSGVKKDLPGGFHDSGLTPFGRFLPPWLRINVNEAVIGNFLNLEIIATCAVKATDARQRSLDSLAKVLDSRIALNYLLSEQGGVCVVANTTCCTWINSSGEIKTQLYKIMGEPLGLKSSL